MTFLSKVEDVFEIAGRGCVLVPGIGEATPKETEVRRHAAIELRKPDGTTIRTHVEALEFLDGPGRRSCVPIILPAGMAKSDVPIGTEIWIVNK